MMDFEQWEPIYEEILRDFGWSRKRDEEAARLLAGLISGRSADVSVLKQKLAGKDVLVCGNALTLSNDLDRKYGAGNVVIAADGATSTLLEKGIVPDIVVTDLDGYIPDEIEANRKGAIMVVHAHGDNMRRLEAVKDMKSIIATTQAAPLGNVHNFGGLSDGDRSVFLAHAFRAKSIKLAGFDLDDKKVSEMKKKKLKWARKLIGMVLTDENVFL